MQFRILLILFLTNCSLTLTAQEYLTTVRHFSEEEGWETRDFRFGFKDSQGFMWFTSEIGAYRYDGYRFKSFKRKTDSDDSYSMNRLGEDSEKNMWFEHPPSIDGINYSILPFGGDSLILFNDWFKEELPFRKDDIADLLFGNNNLIWISTVEGEIFEYYNQSFRKIFQIPTSSRLPLPKSNFGNLQITKSFDNSYWIKVYNDFFIVSSNKVVFKKKIPKENFIHTSINDSLSLISPYLHHMLQTVVKKDNIKELESFITSYKKKQIPHTFIGSPNYFLSSKSDSIYDLQLFDIKNNISIDIEPFGIPNKNISPRSFFVENKNSIWLMTHDGIFHIQLNKKRFQNFLQGTSNREMIRLDDDLWVSSNNGFHKINLKTKSIENRTEENWKYVRRLFWVNPNELWMGKLYGKVAKVNPSQYKIEKEYDLYKNFPYPFDINCFYRDKKSNQLWIGTTNSLLKYEPQSDQFLPYLKTKEFKEIETSTIYHIFENEDLILIATSKGIFQLDSEKGIVAHFSSKNKTLASDAIVFIHQDLIDKTFWLGTKWDGLIHWDMDQNVSEVFNIDRGLSDNLIYAVYEDDHKNLWLPSNKGLMRFNKETQEITTFTQADGLPYNEFNYFSHHQDTVGNLFFGGLNGITIFHPNDFPKTIENAPLRLVDIESLDSKTLKTTSHLNDYFKNKKITFTPSNNSFRLLFALLDFKHPERNRFQYKFDRREEWINVKGNALQLSNLPYGQHSILVRGQNSNGNWSSQELRIPLEIQKPYYLKTSFYLFSALILAGLVSFIIHRRTAILRKEKEKLEEEVENRTKEFKKQAEELKKLDEVKTRFFANVTHELRTPLTLIISPLKQLMKSETLDDKTMRTLTAIAQNSDQLKNLVEEILDLSRYDANKLELQKKSVHFLSEVKKWAMGFDLEAQHRGIDFQIYYQLPIDMQLLVDTQKLKKITTNLLSNAFKHTKSGDSITLEILEKNKNIHLNVIDTGEGIHPNDLPYIFNRFFQSKQTDTQLHGGLGIGLALSKELSILMDGKISVISNLGKGSTFSLEFPKEIQPKEIIQKVEMLEKRKIPQKDLLSLPPSETDNNILIVEDNAQMLAFIQQLLHPIANTFLANNGKNALDFLESSEKKIDLIISDVMMPEMDGFTLLQKLKDQKQWQLIPVIMLTARGDISDKLNAIRIGVDDYLVKPFEPEEMIARVNNLLQNIQLRKKISIPTYEIEEPNLPPMDSADLKWLKNLEQIAFENILTSNFNVSQLAFKMTLSERQINRKLKKLTGLTPGNYLKEIRLQKARQLLENKAYSTVAEISYLIGFSTPDYFSKIYKNRFGKLPSEYLE